MTPPAAPASVSTRTRGWVHAHGAALVELLRLVDAACILIGLSWSRQWLNVVVEGTRWPYAVAALGIYTLVAMHWPIYRSWRGASLRTELILVLQCWLVTSLTLGTVLYLADGMRALPRDLALTWLLVSALLLAASRLVLRLSLRAWRIGGRNFRTAAILGATDIGKSVARQLQTDPGMGVKLRGFYDDRTLAEGRTLSEAALEGSVDDLMAAIASGEIDVVYVALPLRAELRIRDFMTKLRDSAVSVVYVPDFSAFGLLRARWESVGGMPVLNLVDTPHVGIDGMNKRLLDLLGSSVLLLILALPLLVVALVIRLESSGPAIFRQRRYGLDGREFEIYKFRSMRVTEDGKHVFRQAGRDDPRVTRFGAFIRRTSIDELPQLLNVLQGRMSLVGPRPHPVALNETHRRLIDGYMLRHKVKPGITGWAQVNGYRGETDTPEKMSARIHYDLEYIENWTLGLDLRILFKTMFKVMGDPNAY